jgi:hypothetical protein
VSISSGGTLQGTGSVAGAVTASGTVSPGDSVGALSIGALSFTATGKFAYEVDSSASLAAAADLLNVNGNLSILAGAALNAADVGSPNSGLAGGTKFTMISYAGTWDGGIFAGAADDSIVSIGVNEYVINYNDTTGGSNFGGGSYGNYVTLTAIAVPEAGSVLLGSAVCLALGLVIGTRKLNAKRSAV